MTISATVIADSISDAGIRITTMQLRYPRFIHAEFMTHRVFSRNASSSRAVPTAKLLEEVRSDALRAAPIFWGKNQPGMQAAEELSGYQLELAKAEWRSAAFGAAARAESLASLGAHKQIVNRILEPFTHINVVVTATEWDNFFGLRIHKDAQPEMRALALAMWNARQASQPLLLIFGQWHLPYLDVGGADREFVISTFDRTLNEFDRQKLIEVSVARCARVSYLSFETGKRSSVEEDLKLYDRLVGSQPMHASPAEHQATPDRFVDGVGWEQPKLHGNFVGWCQYRKLLPGEAVASLPT